MFYLRDIPKYETIRQRAGRYPNIDPRAVEACLVLMRVASDMLAALDAYLARLEMSQGKFTVLMVLNRDPEVGLSPSELADKCGVTRATMTGLLDGLEREHFISRELHAEDRRKAIVRLTQHAIRFLDAMLPDYYQQTAELMADLPEEQKEEMVELLMKVAQRIPALRAAVPPVMPNHNAAQRNG